MAVMVKITVFWDVAACRRVLLPPSSTQKTFYNLLTLRLVMILGKWPTWRTILLYLFISIIYMFRATSCSSSGESIVSIQHVVYITLCRWPFRVHVGKELSDLHTKRSPDDEHEVARNM